MAKNIQAPGEIDYDEVRRKAGNTNEALGIVPKGPIGSPDNPYIDYGEKVGSNPAYGGSNSYAGSGTTYGLAADVAKNKGAQLYIPGTTKLGSTDVFLGGTGTGVTDAMLGGAQRVWGATAQDTANEYGKYQTQQAKTLATNQANTNQANYEQKLSDLAKQTAQAAADAKKFALKQAWEGNEQALNSQNATVTNNYTSAANKLSALQAARLPEYQVQRDATSAEAAAQLRRTEALNALSGKYFSGANRSQMLNVDLARQNALQDIQGSENAFKTDVGNQLSDVDAQRVAALNDIAGKISLGEQQYNEGTLSLTNQLESEKATGALKAFLDAQTWADTQKQLGIENTDRQAQLDLSKTIADNTKAYQDGMLSLQQLNDANARAIAISGVTGTYNGQPTYTVKQDEAKNKYNYDVLNSNNTNAAADRAAALARGSGGGTKAPTAAEITSQKEGLIGQVTSSIYDKVYGQNDSNEGALRTLTSNKGAILSDLASAGMSAKDALAYYQSMYDDLKPPILTK